MGKTKDTGFLRNLISYDASGNIVLPANLTVTGSLLTSGGATYATQSYVTTQISNLVNAAPGALDTLNELAAALGNDANFSTTVTNSIATKLSLSGGTLTGALTITSGGTERYIQLSGYNNAYTTVRSNVGFNSSYNNTAILTNVNSTESGQGNSAIPSWLINIGGNETEADTFAIKRSPAGSFSFSNRFILTSAGAATFSSSVNATSFVSNITNGYGLLLNRPATTNYNGISHQTLGVAQWFVGMRENSTNNYIIYNESGTDALTILKSNSNVGIRTTNPYSPLTVTGAGVSWGETVTYYPSPAGYITLAFRLEGTDTTTGTWAFGKQSTQENGGTQYLQIAKNGLTGSSLHRTDAVQTWDPSNGNSYFGFKVGIGTTTANGNLQFSNTTNTRKIVLYQGGNNDYEFYGFGVESGRLIYSTYTTGDDHVFVAGTSGTARNEIMRVKGNGQVLRPLQPSFLAYSDSGGFTVTGGGWYNISNALTIESYDITSNYSSGRFTAPVAGRYFFYAGGWANIGTASNGERYAFSAIVNGGGLTFISGGNYCIGDTPLAGYHVIYNLAAGDYVELQVFSAVGGTWGSGTHRVYWGGYLL